MNRSSIILSLVLSIYSCCLQAQNAILLPISPRSNGMGKTSLNFTDLHSLFGNQAGMAKLETFGVMGMVEQRFLLADLRQAAFGAVLPTFSGVFGLTLRNFGTVDYRETGVGVAYARKLSDRLRIGGQLHWAQISIGEYGNRSFFNLDFGVQANFCPTCGQQPRCVTPSGKRC